MRDEGRRSAVQVINRCESHFVLRQGEYVGEAEQVATIDGEETTTKQPEDEETLSKEAAVSWIRLAEEFDPEKRSDDAHLRVVLEHLPPEVDPDQRAAAEEFIRERAGLFSKSEYDIGKTSRVRHVIDTGMHRPFNEAMRRHPLAHLEIIDKHVTEMLQHDIIEPAASPWASNVVLMRNTNGQLRFCVDYRQLNLLTYKDSFHYQGSRPVSIRWEDQGSSAA